MVLCGWAAISETGGINGKKGDQTTKEVRTGNWYYFGQNVVLRFKDRSKAKQAAKYMKAICDNNNVGYGQYDRLSLYNAWRAVGWEHPEKIRTKCNTDCSQLVSNCVIAVGYPILPSNWTGSLKAALLATGGFIALTDTKYLTGDKYLLTGDIILNEQSHVIMALQDGTAPKKSKYTKAGVNYPVKVKQGRAFVCKGIITSANPLTRVEIGIVDHTGNKWTSQKVDRRVTGYTFNISTQADNYLLFGKLKKGTYYYRCWCWDVNGAKCVFNRKFKVV